MSDGSNNIDNAAIAAASAFAGVQAMNSTINNSGSSVDYDELDSVVKNGKVTGTARHIQDTQVSSQDIKTSFSSKQAGVDAIPVVYSDAQTERKQKAFNSFREKYGAPNLSEKVITKAIQRDADKIGTSKFSNFFGMKSIEEFEDLGVTLTEKQKAGFNSYLNSQIVKKGSQGARTAAGGPSNGTVPYKPDSQKVAKSGAYNTNVTPNVQTVEQMAENRNLPAIIDQKTSEDLPGGNKDGDGKTSSKGKWAKRGFIGVGMATLAGLGLAVNSLMINDKGRMNNAQMYGQQPYSQY